MKRIIILHRPKLSSHIHFFQNFVNELNKLHPNTAHLMYFRPLFRVNEGERNYVNDQNKIQKYIFRPWAILRFLIYFNYTGGGVIFLKKYFPRELYYLVRFFSKIEMVTDLEGSYVYETKYLERRNSKGQYSKHIRDINGVLDVLRHRHSFKSIYAVTEPLRTHYSSLFPDYNNFETLNILSPDQRSFLFDLDARNKKRKELGLSDREILITYVGNVFYPWQNISDTLELLFRLQKCNSNIMCLFLVRESDHELFVQFAKQYEIRYILKAVKHSEIPSYLSASDFGIILRKRDELNKLVLSGKLLEYAANGLPTILTKSTHALPDLMLSENLAFNVDLTNINYEGLNQWIVDSKRKNGSNLLGEFSVQANAKRFIKFHL